MKKPTLWVAAVIALCTSAAIVQTWSTSGPIESAPPAPAPRTLAARHGDIDLPAPPAPVRRVPAQAFTQPEPVTQGGGLKARIGWIGAGLAAGHFIGPVGSVGVGAAKYRQDLKAGGKRRFGAIGRIGVPVAISVLAGPIGTVGYAGFQHRTWLKEHVLRIGNDDQDDQDEKNQKASKRNKLSEDKRGKGDVTNLKASTVRAKGVARAD